MPRFMPTTIHLVWLLACSVSMSGCGEQDRPSASAPGSNSAQTNVEAQFAPRPCEWVPQTQAESILGKLTRAPHVSWSASTLDPDPHGEACVYSVAREKGAAEIALQIDLTGGLAEEQGMGMGIAHAFKVAEEEGLDGEHGEMVGAFVKGLTSAPEAAQTDAQQRNWDYSGRLPGLIMWRIGHVAIRIGGETMLVPEERLARLAAHVRDSLSDRLPFASRGEGGSGSFSGRNPCDLLHRAEAESVLGELVVPPYRSSEESPLAHPHGSSCSYLTRGHRVLVITPEYSDGEMLFGMVAGFGGLIRSSVGGADEGDLLDGPWDSATARSDGVLYFLRDDSMLMLGYRTSNTDLAGARRLAEIAVPRL